MFQWQQKAQKALLPPPPACHCLCLEVSVATQSLQPMQVAPPKGKVNKLPWRFKLALKPLTWQAPQVWVHNLNPVAEPISEVARLALHTLNVKKTNLAFAFFGLPAAIQATSHMLATTLPNSNLNSLNITLARLFKYKSLKQQHLSFISSFQRLQTLFTTVTIFELSPQIYDEKSRQDKASKTLYSHWMPCRFSLPALSKLEAFCLKPNTHEALKLAWQEPVIRKSLLLQRLPFTLQQQLRHNLAKRFQVSLEKIQLTRVYDRIQEQLFRELNVSDKGQLYGLLKQAAMNLKLLETHESSFLVVAKQLNIPLGVQGGGDKWLTALISEVDLQPGEQPE